MPSRKTSSVLARSVGRNGRAAPMMAAASSGLISELSLRVGPQLARDLWWWKEA
jgi:hypothetical protein